MRQPVPSSELPVIDLGLILHIPRPRPSNDGHVSGVTTRTTPTASTDTTTEWKSDIHTTSTDMMKEEMETNKLLNKGVILPSVDDTTPKAAEKEGTAECIDLTQTSTVPIEQQHYKTVHAATPVNDGARHVNNGSRKPSLLQVAWPILANHFHLTQKRSPHLTMVQQQRCTKPVQAPPPVHQQMPSFPIIRKDVSNDTWSVQESWQSSFGTCVSLCH